MTKEPTSGLSSEQLRRLLALGEASAGREGVCADPGDELRRMLDSELPLNEASPDSMPALLGELEEAVWEAFDQPMRGLLTDPHTATSVLRTIKEYAKRLVHKATTPRATQAAATAVYYAAIASLLVYHREKASQRPYGRLADGLVVMSQKSWMPADLAELYARALAVCRLIDRDTEAPSPL